MQNLLKLRSSLGALLILASLSFGSCAFAATEQDPFEKFNRGVFAFNKVVDKYIIKPVSYVYLVYCPQPLQSGIGNFFENLKEITNVANDLLQFEFSFATYDSSRFLINSTVGILGIFDVASSLGLEHRKEDFGKTLYRWGYKHSSYLMLPVIGPSTFRDAIGFGVDYTVLSIWPWVEPKWRYILLGIDAVDARARLLRHEVVLDVVGSVDEYVFIRDAYFQRRQYLFDGAANSESLDNAVSASVLEH